MSKIGRSTDGKLGMSDRKKGCCENKNFNLMIAVDKESQSPSHWAIRISMYPAGTGKIYVESQVSKSTNQCFRVSPHDSDTASRQLVVSKQFVLEQPDRTHDLVFPMDSWVKTQLAAIHRLELFYSPSLGTGNST